MRHITSFEQPEQLLSALDRAGVEHGQTRRVNIDFVNVAHLDQPEQSLDVPRHASLFCQCEVTAHEEIIEKGDGEFIPYDRPIFISGTSKLRPFRGMVRLDNVLVRSNGHTEIILDDKTSVTANEKLVIVS